MDVDDDAERSLLALVRQQSFEDVVADFGVPFRDVHRLEAWASVAASPTPDFEKQDLFAFIGPALRRLQIGRRLSDEEVCARAQIPSALWQQMISGQNVPFDAFTKAFRVVTGGAFLPLREAALVAQLQQRFAEALKENEVALGLADAGRGIS